MYAVDFILRSDTNGFAKTNLINWESKIAEAISDFNQKSSRLTDRAVMSLCGVFEKHFTVNVDIDERFSPNTRSFYTRVGAVSRCLKDLGMLELLSPHGKLFSLSVKSNAVVENANIIYEEEHGKGKNIYLDYKNKVVMIPKEIIEEFVIRFY